MTWMWLSVGQTLTLFTAGKIAADPKGFSEITVSICQSLYFCGFALASAVLTPNLDRFGRKGPCFVLLGIGTLCSMLSALSTRPWHLGATLFAMGFTLPPSSHVGYLLIQESLPKRLHAFITAFCSAGYSVVLALMALSSRWLTSSLNWRLETLAWHSPMLLVLVLGSIFIEEPPKAPASDETGEEQSSGVRAVLTSKLRVTTLLTCLCWTAASFGYYALSFSAGNLSPDLHLNVILLCIVDIFAFSCAMPVVERLGARRAQTLGFTGATFTILLCAIFPVGSRAVVLFALACRLFLDVAFTTVFLLIMECYGPECRAAGAGIANAVCRAFTLMAPLCTVAPPLFSQLLMGGLCAAAALSMRKL